MVEIRESEDNVEVVADGFRERFRNRFRAIMAAHALAGAEAKRTGKAVTVAVPTGWGDAMVIGGTLTTR